MSHDRTARLLEIGAVDADGVRRNLVAHAQIGQPLVERQVGTLRDVMDGVGRLGVTAVLDFFNRD